jgi:glucose-1-phosphate cytidylyltransferase
MTADPRAAALADHGVVVLCGGRGRRLGSLGDTTPKPLAPVLGRPILWYILLGLHQAGFRRFILPLGYLGEQIRAYVTHDLAGLDARVDMIDTGEETEIGQRLLMVRGAIGSENLLLINGDTLFDFDIAGLVEMHRRNAADLTLTSCEIVSQYGLLLERDGHLVGFARDSRIREYVVSRPGAAGEPWFINAGIAVLRKSTLDVDGIASAGSFETFLYPQLIARGTALHYHIDGFWHAIDTQKDLDIANSPSSDDPRSVASRKLRDHLEGYATSLGLDGGSA